MMNYIDQFAHEKYQNCGLCPRNCGVNRNQGQKGFCGETNVLRIADIEAHFGEEPPISGIHGSGTIFITGCSLKCVYCQNYQISIQKLGRIYPIEQVTHTIEKLFHRQHIHNINFVSVDHFFPAAVAVIENLKKRNLAIPAVFNVSGYQKIDSLQYIESVTDIYLPDYKYSSSDLASTLSNAADYPIIALAAISEMVRQKGFLHIAGHDGIADRGVLVRHLILPGQIQNSINALTSLAIEFGSELPISLMSQYTPARPNRFDFLNRQVTIAEFNIVYEHALSLNFENMFVQFPQVQEHDTNSFLPDFQKQRPFSGNVEKINWKLSKG